MGIDSTRWLSDAEFRALSPRQKRLLIAARDGARIAREREAKLNKPRVIPKVPQKRSMTREEALDFLGYPQDP